MLGGIFYLWGSSVIADSASLEERGRVQGVADFCIFSFVALASMFSGMVHSEFGWTFMVSISSLVIVLISFALVFGRPTLKEEVISCSFAVKIQCCVSDVFITNIDKKRS